MSDQTRLDELLLHYEDLRNRNEAVTPEELCRDCPELLAELKGQIAALESLDVLLNPPADSATPLSGQEPDLVEARSAAGPVDPLTAQTTYRVLRRHAQGGLGEVFVVHDE
jgi:hypothetical protein